MPETYQVEITSIAERDIGEIWDYISQDNPEVAETLILTIEDRIKKLEIFPMRCPLVPENEILGTGYRQILHGNYRIIFTIMKTRVIIMRVIHRKRSLDTSLFLSPHE